MKFITKNRPIRIYLDGDEAEKLYEALSYLYEGASIREYNAFDPDAGGFPEYVISDELALVHKFLAEFKANIE